jgi:hypothetical protein
MRIWIDCEWNDYKGALISMALVAEDADTAPWYAVLECKNPSPWVAENVMPCLEHTPRVDREYMQESLQRFLCLFDSVHIIADWPEDIERFCELLIVGPGQRIDTPPLTMEVRRDINSDASELPHNALADAQAMKAMHLALTPAPADGWVSVPREPDEAMIQAGCDTFSGIVGTPENLAKPEYVQRMKNRQREAVIEHYKAMIEAAERK